MIVVKLIATPGQPPDRSAETDSVAARPQPAFRTRNVLTPHESRGVMSEVNLAGRAARVDGVEGELMRSFTRAHDGVPAVDERWSVGAIAFETAGMHVALQCVQEFPRAANVVQVDLRVEAGRQQHIVRPGAPLHHVHCRLVRCWELQGARLGHSQVQDPN